jgi:hypothetical protein
MKNVELMPWDKSLVEVTLTDGTVYQGRFYTTPEIGLYHVEPDPISANMINISQPEDILAADIVSIKRLT